MAKASLIVCLSLLLAIQVQSAAIQWTGGAGNGLWNFANNWSPAAVPTAADDVTINAVGGATVTVGQPATARSIIIGGSSFGQSLVVLTRLAVGSGGIRAASGATVNVQNNNDAPISSVGTVNFAAGSQFIFQSGSIRGPGDFIVASGATLTFSQAAQKQIAATNLTVVGTTTIQASTIQLAAGGKFINQGTVTALGAITILAAADNSTTRFENRGTFTYNGNSDNTKPIYFLANTYFYTTLTINNGRAVVGETFTTTATVNFRSNAVLEIQAGAPNQVANFASVDGSTLVIGGNARFSGSVSVNNAKVADSGSVAFLGDVLIDTFAASGKVTASQRVRVNAFTVSGGNINTIGSGVFNVTTITIQDAASGNTNNFINAVVIVNGNSTISENVVVLFGAMGNLWIAHGAHFNIFSESRFVSQVGSPSIRVDGIMNVEAKNGYISSNVHTTGSGIVNVRVGKVDFDTAHVDVKIVVIESTGFVNFVDCTLNISLVLGSGGVNVSTLPGTNNLGRVQTGYLGFINGPVRVDSFTAQAVSIYTSDVTINGTMSQSKAFEIYFRGGSITGKNATIDTNILQIGGGPTNEIIDGVHFTAKTFKLLNTGAIIIKNGASITVV